MERKNTSQENENLCEKCGEEPVFMNGLCVFCYEDEFLGNENFEDRKKSSNMIVQGGPKGEDAIKRDQKRAMSKIFKIEKKIEKKRKNK